MRRKLKYNLNFTSCTILTVRDLCAQLTLYGHKHISKSIRCDNLEILAE